MREVCKRAGILGGRETEGGVIFHLVCRVDHIVDQKGMAQKKSNDLKEVVIISYE